MMSARRSSHQRRTPLERLDQRGPVDSLLLSTSRRKIDAFQPLVNGTGQSNPAGVDGGGSEASNDGCELYGAARLLIVRC